MTGTTTSEVPTSRSPRAAVGMFLVAFLIFLVPGSVTSKRAAVQILADPLSHKPKTFLEPDKSVSSGRTIASCQVLNSRGTRYILTNDVTSPGTCFSIQADNITLELNRHSIKYGTAPSRTAAFAILGVACWDTILKNGVANNNPCGGKFDNFTVLNGSIEQSAGMAPFSDGIHLGQGGGDRLRVDNVAITVQSDSAIPVYTNSSGAGAIVRNNTIHNNVKSIQNRHQLHGMTVKFDNSREIRPGQSVYKNKILGGAQGGIVLVSEGAAAYENEISQDGRYTNDFAIYMWGNRQQVYNNMINAISGRGIQVGGGAISVNGRDAGGRDSAAHDNHIQVIELQQNCSDDGSSCSGCEPGGAYGIQFDDNPQGDAAFHNTVLGRADQCDAVALRITDSRHAKNESYDNTFSAVRLHPNSPGKAYGWDNAGPTRFQARNDVFAGDTATYHVSWDGAQNEECISCTLGKGTGNPNPEYVTFSFQNGGLNSVKNVHFRDAIFVSGAKKDSTDMQPILSRADWPGPAEYFIDWTVTLFIHDQHKMPVPGAVISITNALGRVAYEGETNPDGKISIPLPEFRTYNTPVKVIQERYTPYRVTFQSPKCSRSPASFPIEITEPTSRDIEVRCEPN